MKRPTVLTWLILAAILLDGVWFLLWRKFTTGFPGRCGTPALMNSWMMMMCSFPSVPLIWLGLRACRDVTDPSSLSRFLLRLPFVLLFTFTIARFPVYIALDCHGHPPSEWFDIAALAVRHWLV